jgi:hypothetical protein
VTVLLTVSVLVGALAVVIAASFSSCFGDKTKPGVDTLKADSLKKDSLAKVAAAAKPDPGKTKTDTAKKK